MTDHLIPQNNFSQKESFFFSRNLDMAAGELIQSKQNDFPRALPLPPIGLSQRFIFGFDDPLKISFFTLKIVLKSNQH